MSSEQVGDVGRNGQHAYGQIGNLFIIIVGNGNSHDDDGGDDDDANDDGGGGGSDDGEIDRLTTAMMMMMIMTATVGPNCRESRGKGWRNSTPMARLHTSYLWSNLSQQP